MSEQNHSLYENSDYPSRRQAPSRQEPPRRSRRKHRGRRVVGTVFKVLGTLLLIGLCTGALLCCFAAVYINQVIVRDAKLALDDFALDENSVMYYQDKTTGQYVQMATVLNTTSSVWVDYEDIPEDLINATVAIEDERFWEHPGVDWKRTGKAVLSMFTGGDISGGSTITQQLIKNLTLYNETTVKRKLTEIVRALYVTQNNTKEDTITYYLNIIPLGSGCKGVGTAAYEYFGKSVSDLSLAECASLISITNNPSKYGPYSSTSSETKTTGEIWNARQWNKWRQENVLDKMLELGMITQKEHDDAVAEELVFVRASDTTEETTIYSWYEETVISDVRKDLGEKLGWSESKVDQMMQAGGLRIYTCMDPDIQAIAESVYTDRSNLDYTSSDGQQMQSSITIIDNSTGDVVAIVGQFGEKTGNLWTNYANSAKRQPGSSLKPLSVYSPALEMGLISPISVIDDYPYNDSNGSGWPLNSGSESYRGKTTVRSGLTRSVNTIAVRILADYVTPQASFQFVEDNYKIDLVKARQVGSTVKSDIDVAPLAMGGLTDGTCTRDMAEAYATFPNGGEYTYSRTYTKITRVVDGKETVLLENEPQTERVIKESTAYYMNSMLQNVVTSGTGTGAQLSNMTAAGKTGTTSENHDRWFVGYTPYYTAAVWTGYPYNAKMSGSNRAVELWKKVMSQVHQGLSNKSFPEPDGLKSVSYCLDSGYLATDYCKMDPRGSRVASDYVFQEDFPEGMYCPVHTDDSLVYVCTDSPILDTDSSTGLYHIAGPNCPEDSLRQMCLPDYERKHIGTATAQDERYRKSVVESYGICTVHTEALPTVEDPEDTEPPSNNTNTTPDNQSTPPSWLGVAPWEQPATDPEDTTENEPEDQPDAQEPNDPNLDLPQDETEDQEDDFWWIDW